MNIKDFVSKYWFEAIKFESETTIPAMYLLTHAALDTNLGESKTPNYMFGFKPSLIPIEKVEDEIKIETNKFKKFFIKLWGKIKSLFNKKTVGTKSIITEVKTQVTENEDFVLDFFKNVSYHSKFEYIQSESMFSEFSNKNIDDFKNMLKLIKNTLHELGHI
jgi:hypothetical protein